MSGFGFCTRCRVYELSCPHFQPMQFQLIAFSTARNFDLNLFLLITPKVMNETGLINGNCSSRMQNIKTDVKIRTFEFRHVWKLKPPKYMFQIRIH